MQRVRVAAEDVGGDVVRLRITSRGARLLGFEVSAYVVGTLLIDTGFPYARRAVLEALDGRRIEAVCCTHNHEDHVGNCAAVAALHECPVYLRNAHALWEEGVRRLKPYRMTWWGPVDAFEPREMPDEVEGGGRCLHVVPAPGHSATQVSFFEEASGDLYTGDLYVAPGAAAVLSWSDPWQEAASLRRVAALEPKRMLTGHGLISDDPVPLLKHKAERIEEAARRSVELLDQGLAPRQVVRRVFTRGRLKDRFFEHLTSHEFSRLNFVLAAARYFPKHMPE